MPESIKENLSGKIEGRSPAALSLSYVVMLIKGLSNHMKGGVFKNTPNWDYE